MLSFFPRDVLDEILDLIESVLPTFSTSGYPRSMTVVFHSMVELHRVQSPVNVIDRRQEVRPKLV